MKGKQTALFPGNGDKIGFWITPPDLMAQLNAEFHFDFDPCPYPRPAGFNGLNEDWGCSNYVNPPFGQDVDHGTNSMTWARKGIAEAEKGKTVVFILPVSGWVETLLEAGAEVRHVGRVKWLNPSGKAIQRPRWGSALFILRPRPALDGGESARSARSPSLVSPKK